MTLLMVAPTLRGGVCPKTKRFGNDNLTHWRIVFEL